MNTITKTLLALAVAVPVMAATVSATVAGAQTSKETAFGSVYKLNNGVGKAADYCSAVAITNKLLISAFHCDVEDMWLQRVEKVNSKEVSYSYSKVKRIKTNTTSDQMLLEVEDSSIVNPVACISDKPVEQLEEVVAIGFPKAKERSWTDGKMVTEVDMTPYDPALKDVFYQTTAPITGGNSGGGLFVERDGQYCLTGIATAGWKDFSAMTYFSTERAIKATTDGMLGPTKTILLLPPLNEDLQKTDNR